MRVLASHQCDRLGLIPGVSIMHCICGLNLLLLLSSLLCWVCSRSGLSLRFSEDGLSEIVAGQKSSSSSCSCYVLLIFRLRVAG